MRHSSFRQRARRPRRPPETMRPASRHQSHAEGMKSRVTFSYRISHQGHGLRASLAFDQLPARPSLLARQRHADHDRGEKCGFGSPPRGRTVGVSPARSARTTVRMFARSVRVSKWRPMEDGRAATLARIDGRSGAAARHQQPRRCGTLGSQSRRLRTCRPPGCH